MAELAIKLTEKMVFDRQHCDEDSNCSECSCCMANGECLFNFIEEHKVGKWIECWDEDHLVVLAYQCSECETMRNAKTNYCADCGADMRGCENG